MSEQAKIDLKTYGAGLLGFLVVVGVGAALILPRGGAPAKAPVSEYAPVDAAADMPKAAPLRAAPQAGAPLASPVPVAPASSPLPILPREESPSAAPAPSSAAVAPAKSPKLNPTAHVASSSSARSSASASTASAPAAPKTAAAKKAFVAPKLDLSKSSGGSIAASVHYGVSNRAELMGRAAGPVYNFSGKGAAAPAAQTGAISGSALEQVSAVQNTLDKSELDKGSRDQLDQNLNKVRDAVGNGQ